MPWVTRKNGEQRFYFRLSRRYGRRRVWIKEPVIIEFLTGFGNPRSRESQAFNWMLSRLTELRLALQTQETSNRDEDDHGSH